MVESREERIAIGRIRTSHGVRGFLKVESYSGETEHFLRLDRIELGDGARRRSFGVEEVHASAGHLLLKLEGLDSRETARAYAGWEIYVDRSLAAPLGDGEYYFSDLCKCDVVKGNRHLGKILSVCEGGGGELLEVELDSGKRSFVPFRKEFVGRVDIANHFVELEADWLLT